MRTSRRPARISMPRKWGYRSRCGDLMPHVANPRQTTPRRSHSPLATNSRSCRLMVCYTSGYAMNAPVAQLDRASASGAAPDRR
jgi:hypothetical protein